MKERASFDVATADGNVVVRDHGTNPSAVLELPWGDTQELTLFEAREIIAALTRVCEAVEADIARNGAEESDAEAVPVTSARGLIGWVKR